MAEALTAQALKVGGRYNWKNQPERLKYVGMCEPRNGRWHQFEKVDEPGIVWCEVLPSDLHMLEETPTDGVDSVELLRHDREWRDYPIGTKAHAYNGGAWLRTERGWTWNGHTRSPGSTFPTPGADAFGKCIELPTPGVNGLDGGCEG